MKKSLKFITLLLTSFLLTGCVNSFNSSSTSDYIVDNSSSGNNSSNSETPSPSDEIVHVNSVSLNATSKSLTVGDSFSLIASVYPTNASDKSVKFSSSNSSIASVNSSGNVSALSEGTATIKVSTTDGEKSATCEVNVTKKSALNQVVIKSNNTNTNEGNEITSFGSNAFTFEGTGISNFNASGTKIYSTANSSYRLASSNNQGTLTFTFDKVAIKGISINAASYGNDKNVSATIVTSSNATGQTVSLTSSSAKDYEFSTFSTISECSSIIISSKDASKKRFYLYSITLTLGSIEKVYPTAIDIPSTLNVGIGTSESLSVSYTPNNVTEKDVTWTSSDKNIVKVDDGVVSGIALGTATITVTAIDKDGNQLTDSCEVNVITISATGVTLSKTSLSLRVGNTETLIATVKPTNATNKAVTFESNNESVAKVSSSGVVSGIKTGSATITVTTSDGGFKDTCNVEVTETILDAWTIMIYMCGSDLESENGLATSDIKEILSVKNKPDNVNIIIETGGAKSWKTSGISSSKLQRFEVKNNQLSSVASLTKASMGKPSTFQSFMEWGLSNYPAQRTGVIFWNHGGGLYGVCYDENYNGDYLENYETESALDALNLTSKLEFVGYDACLMQVQDVAMSNSKYFNYMVASQESEVGYGWDYDSWLPYIYNNPESVDTNTVLKSIADSFIDDNGGVNAWKYG